MNPCVYVDRTIYVSLIQLAKYFAFSEAVSQHLLFTVDSQLKRNKKWVYALKNLSRMRTKAAIGFISHQRDEEHEKGRNKQYSQSP